MVFTKVFFVGLDKSDNQRKCSLHDVCGANPDCKVGCEVTFERAPSYGPLGPVAGSLKLSRVKYPDTIFVKFVRPSFSFLFFYYIYY